MLHIIQMRVSHCIDSYVRAAISCRGEMCDSSRCDGYHHLPCAEATNLGALGLPMTDVSLQGLLKVRSPINDALMASCIIPVRMARGTLVEKSSSRCYCWWWSVERRQRLPVPPGSDSRGAPAGSDGGCDSFGCSPIVRSLLITTGHHLIVGIASLAVLFSHRRWTAFGLMSCPDGRVARVDSVHTQQTVKMGRNVGSRQTQRYSTS